MSLGGCFTMANGGSRAIYVLLSLLKNDPLYIIPRHSASFRVIPRHSASLPWTSFRVITVDFIPRVITSQ